MHYINMADISRKTYERNGIETADNDGILWFNEKHLEEGLDHNNLRKATTKYHSHHKKQRYELVEKRKKQFNRIFIDENLAIRVIMDCSTISAHKLRTWLGFKQFDAISIKEKSVLIKYLVHLKDKICKNYATI